jgi:hypothetical protein
MHHISKSAPFPKKCPSAPNIEKSNHNMGEDEGTLTVIGKGYNEHGERCYLVGYQEGRVFSGMTLVEMQSGFFTCVVHGRNCPHTEAVKAYLKTLDNCEQEIKPRPRKKGAKGAGKAGTDRIYLTMIPPPQTTNGTPNQDV